MDRHFLIGMDVGSTTVKAVVIDAANDQILWRYVNDKGEPTEIANPNGSVENIAGICNEARNIAGLMPHPERASEPLLGSADGRAIFESLIDWMEQKTKAQAA